MAPVKLSSSLTVFYKVVFPVLWLGLVTVATIAAFFADAPAGFVVIPLFAIAFVYVLLRFLVFDLVDEVELHGNELVVRNRDIEERVPLSSIANITSRRWCNPERITLELREPGQLGARIAFTPTLRFMPLFSPHPIELELRRLVDQGV